jgi:hypothetical protein
VTTIVPPIAWRPLTVLWALFVANVRYTRNPRHALRRRPRSPRRVLEDHEFLALGFLALVAGWVAAVIVFGAVANSG